MTRERILIVDDEETIRVIFASAISSEGNYDCRAAGDGLEALALLDSGEKFDLVLADIVMPNLDGIQLAERIKDKYPDLPVVMVTAVHTPRTLFEAIQKGAVDYILKPFEVEELLDVIRRFDVP